MAPLTAKGRCLLSTSNGRPLNVAFSLNGRCFNSPNTIPCQDANGVDQLHNKLFLHFNANSFWSTVTLRITGSRDPSTLNESEETNQLYHLFVVFEGMHITHWSSSSLKSGKFRPALKAPRGYVVTDNNPMRIIKFEAKDCTIHGGIIPKLENHTLQKQMNDIVKTFDNARKKKKLFPLSMLCVVDEYRADRATFVSFREAELKDKWLKPRHKGV
jgi:hypothetical protein